MNITFDDKLMWKVPIKTQVKKELDALWLFYAFTRATSGQTPKMTFHKRVLIPKITNVTIAELNKLDIT